MPGSVGTTCLSEERLSLPGPLFVGSAERFRSSSAHLTNGSVGALSGPHATTFVTMARYRLTIAYDGTDFHGWQRQYTTPDRGLPRDSPIIAELPNGRVELRTVQGVVQHAVQQVVDAPITVEGASRTDAGVHARAQCGALTVEDDAGRPPDERLAAAINAKLPADVLVRECVRTRDDFQPITDCASKGYRYTIHSGPVRPLWTRREVWWTYEKLEAEAMRTAGALLVGQHDFASFAAAAHGRESTVRTIFSCDVTESPGEHKGTRRIALDVSGDGFLYNMVRIIAGTLMEVGRGRFPPGEIKEMLLARDRAAAGPTLGPAGLSLEWIRYPDFTCGNAVP